MDRADRDGDCGRVRHCRLPHGRPGTRARRAGRLRRFPAAMHRACGTRSPSAICRRPSRPQSSRNVSRLAVSSRRPCPKCRPAFSVIAFAAWLQASARDEDRAQWRHFPRGKRRQPHSCAARARRCGQDSERRPSLPRSPSGLSASRFYPAGPNPEWVYIASMSEVVRFPYRDRRHQSAWTDRDDRVRLCRGPRIGRATSWCRRTASIILLAVGSSTNIAGQWARSRSSSAPTSSNSIPMAAAARCSPPALRNPVAIALQSRSTARFGLRSTSAICSATICRPITSRMSSRANSMAGRISIIGNHRDPRVKGDPPVPGEQVVVGDVLIQPHSAPLGIAFYTGDSNSRPSIATISSSRCTARGTAACAPATSSSASSWRTARPPASIEDFMTGFVTADGTVWGRPVGVAGGAGWLAADER